MVVFICIYDVIYISPGNLDSSLCFIQPSISHDVLRLSTDPLIPGTSPCYLTPTNQKKICIQWKTLTPTPQMILHLKTFMVKQNPGCWFLDMSLPPPQVADLLNKIIFAFQPTLVSQVLIFKPKQPNLGLVHTHTHTHTHTHIYTYIYTGFHTHTHIYTHMVFVL